MQEEVMKMKLTFLILASMFAALVSLSVARADDSDQATQLTFNQSVQIPGKVLPAGTYWFAVVDPIYEPDAVRIFNSDRTAVVATVPTISAERNQPSGSTVITLAEEGAMQPVSVVSWFYPGRAIGHEFLYSKRQEKELAKAKQYTIMASADHIVPAIPSGD
jgi:hypothetical protein